MTISLTSFVFFYLAGQTDEVKGTGVFSSFELKRDKEEDAKDDEKDNES